MALDLGDTWSATFYTVDASGTPAAPAALPVATITKPDATTTTATVTLTAVGTYRADYVTAATPGRYTLSVSWAAATAVAGVYTDAVDVVDMSEVSIVSLSEMKRTLRLTTLTPLDEDLLRSYLEEATSLAERYTGRSLRRKTQTEVYDGGFSGSITLRQLPVISITTVVENGVTLSATDYTLNATAGLLYRGSTVARIPWYPGRQCISVTYVSGYAAPPMIAQRGVKDICRWMWQQGQEGPRPGFGQSANDPTYSTDALPTWLFRPLDAIQKVPGIA